MTCMTGTSPRRYGRVVTGAGVCVLLLVAGGLRAAVEQQSAPALQEMLARGASYVTTYEEQLSGLVYEEYYTQVVRVHARTTARRVLRSDVLLVLKEGAGWYGFRDVFEVDGSPVRDRDQRLYRLFIEAAPDAVDRANAIVHESARFNVGSIKRNINVPTLALAFLRRENLARSEFSFRGVATVGDAQARILEFSETRTPRIINTPDRAAVKGRVWLEVDSSRVMQTELTIDSVAALATVLVTYGPQARVPGVLVPVKMEEHYRVGPREVITGSAVYSNFRAFKVETTIKR